MFQAAILFIPLPCVLQAVLYPGVQGQAAGVMGSEGANPAARDVCQAPHTHGTGTLITILGLYLCV